MDHNDSTGQVTTTCQDCDADLVRIDGVGWVDTLSGDDGGTYDVCPDRYDDVNNRQRGHRPRPVALDEDDTEQITLAEALDRFHRGLQVVPAHVLSDGVVNAGTEVSQADYVHDDRVVIRYGAFSKSGHPQRDLIRILRAGVVTAKARRLA